MKRTIVAVAMAMAGVAACDGAGGAAEQGLSRSDADVSASASTEAPASALPAADPAMPGAPDFAALYPGAVVDATPTIADGAAGPGGLLTFVTEAEPDAVVTFYKRRAEASGLASIMAMNQGDAQAYGAASPQGASLQVVAAPAEDGTTSVQLTWSAGQ